MLGLVANDYLSTLQLYVGLPSMKSVTIAKEKEQNGKHNHSDVVFFCSTLLLQHLYRVLSHIIIPSFITIVKHSTSQDGQSTTLITFYICSPTEVTFDHVSFLWDHVCVESPQWNHYYKQQVCGLMVWMNPIVCTFRGLYYAKKKTSLPLEKSVKTWWSSTQLHGGGKREEWNGCFVYCHYFVCLPYVFCIVYCMFSLSMCLPFCLCCHWISLSLGHQLIATKLVQCISSLVLEMNVFVNDLWQINENNRK